MMVLCTNYKNLMQTLWYGIDLPCISCYDFYYFFDEELILYELFDPLKITETFIIAKKCRLVWSRTATVTTAMAKKPNSLLVSSSPVFLLPWRTIAISRRLNSFLNCLIPILGFILVLPAWADLMRVFRAFLHLTKVLALVVTSSVRLCFPVGYNKFLISSGILHRRLTRSHQLLRGMSEERSRVLRLEEILRNKPFLV